MGARVPDALVWHCMQAENRPHAKFTLRWPRRRSGTKDDAGPSRQGSAAGPLPVNGQQEPPAEGHPAQLLPPRAGAGGKRRSVDAAPEPNLEMEMSTFTSPERGEELRPLHPLAAAHAAPAQVCHLSHQRSGHDCAPRP